MGLPIANGLVVEYDGTSHMPRRIAAQTIDTLTKAVDRMHYDLAKDCGLGGAAYWLMYGIEIAGGTASQHALGKYFSYPKQTMSSALKVLEKKGLVTLEFEADSRRNKQAVLTKEGRVFCAQYIVPAIEAEDRALKSLKYEERTELVRLMNAYASAIDQEMERIQRPDCVFVKKRGEERG